MSKAVFNLKKSQKNLLTIAHELCYNETVIERIKSARTQTDLDNAMRYGRETYYKEGYTNVCAC